MNRKNYLSLKLSSTWFSRAMLFAAVALAFFAAPQTASAVTMTSFDNAAGGEAATQFNNLRAQLQGFAVVVLLILLVIAAIMAAMQKVTMAINVAIAAIILFGGGYIMLLIYEGLQSGS